MPLVLLIFVSYRNELVLFRISLFRVFMNVTDQQVYILRSLQSWILEFAFLVVLLWKRNLSGMN